MLKLHGFCASNYVNMVKFALLEKGADYQFVTRYPDQDNTTLTLSPMGKMPALETEHGVLTETGVILEYIDQVAGGPALFPEAPFQRARVKQLMHMIEIYLELPARSCYPEAFFGGKVSDEVKQQAREALDKGTRALARLTDFQPFIAGDRLTAADALFLYSFDLACAVAGKLLDLDLPGQAPGAADLLARLNERDSARQIAADRNAAMADFLKHMRGSR